MENWSLETWVAILGGAGVVIGWVFSILTLREDIKSRRISNLLALIHNHQKLWTLPIKFPELKRVMQPNLDLTTQPITPDEANFVNMAIQHLSGGFQAMQSGLVIEQEGLRADVSAFFALPIPKVLWERVKRFQNEDFIRFVEESRFRV